MLADSSSPPATSMRDSLTAREAQMSIIATIHVLHTKAAPLHLKTLQMAVLPRVGEYIKDGPTVVQVAYVVHEGLSVHIYTMPAELPASASR